MAKKKRRKRRVRTAHPGVKLVTRERASRSVWLARWTDPDTGRAKEVSLTRLGLRDDDARRRWAIKKSEAIAGRRRIIRTGGAVPAPAVSVPEAVEDHLERATEKLRPVTIEGKRHSLERLKTWAKLEGIRHVNDLAGPHLARLKDHLERLKRRNVVRNGRRGERKESRRRRATRTVNGDLQRIRAFLNEARRFGRTPHLDREVISENLQAIRGEQPRPAFLRAAEIQELLRAAVRHDMDCWELTREEKDGKRPAGTTPKHDPVGPFILFVLLSGCRAGEARALRWEHCYLEGQAPEIVLPSGAVKTKIERAVDLECSPSLVKLLEALRLRTQGEYVFGGEKPLSRTYLEKVKYRLTRNYGAPRFTYQRLRQSTACFLVNAPGIYEAASIYRSCERLGHSVDVARQSYLGLVRDIPREARTLEAAMGTEEIAEGIVRRARGVEEGDAAAAAG